MRQRAPKTIVAAILFIISATGGWAQENRVIVIDESAPSHPFPHFWERMFGSGRAILTLRESYREDLREVKRGPRQELRPIPGGPD